MIPLDPAISFAYVFDAQDGAGSVTDVPFAAGDESSSYRFDSAEDGTNGTTSGPQPTTRQPLALDREAT